MICVAYLQVFKHASELTAASSRGGAKDVACDYRNSQSFTKQKAAAL
jgi:hypothetical protein